MTRAATWLALAALVSGGLVLGSGAETAGAQAADAAQTSADAMQQLGFLVGQWQGDGWIELGPGRRVPFVETETAAWKLDGLALLIEGRGTQPTPAPPAEAAVVHAALALVTYDAAAQQYDFRAYQASQGAASAVAATARLVDGGLVWGFTPNPDGPLAIRYTITLSDGGEWVEVGEVAPDGQTWREFFEMTLQRQS